MDGGTIEISKYKSQIESILSLDTNKIFPSFNSKGISI